MVYFSIMFIEDICVERQYFVLIIHLVLNSSIVYFDVSGFSNGIYNMLGRYMIKVGTAICGADKLLKIWANGVKLSIRYVCHQIAACIV